MNKTPANDSKTSKTAKTAKTARSTSGKKPVRRKNKKAGPQGRYLLPAMAGIVVVCLLVALAGLWRSLCAGPEPSEVTTAPTEATLPPNPYRAGDFSYDEKGYLACSAGSYRLGIDVSDHQQEINWSEVAAAGMEFAFIRIGYRGYSEGGLFLDEQAHNNFTNAKAAGLDVGAYFYSQALNEEEAAQEAAFCVEFLNEYELDLPVVFDWEYVSQEARTGAMDAQTLTACALRFCRDIENAGYDAMIYFNPHLAQDYYRLLDLQQYPFWLAMYSDTMDYPYRVDLWQYTDQGSVPGISTAVDVDLQFTYD